MSECEIMSVREIMCVSERVCIKERVGVCKGERGCVFLFVNVYAWECTRAIARVCVGRARVREKVIECE